MLTSLIRYSEHGEGPLTRTVGSHPEERVEGSLYQRLFQGFLNDISLMGVIPKYVGFQALTFFMWCIHFFSSFSLEISPLYVTFLILCALIFSRFKRHYWGDWPLAFYWNIIFNSFWHKEIIKNLPFLIPFIPFS